MKPGDIVIIQKPSLLQGAPARVVSWSPETLTVELLRGPLQAPAYRRGERVTLLLPYEVQPISPRRRARFEYWRLRLLYSKAPLLQGLKK